MPTTYPQISITNMELTPMQVLVMNPTDVSPTDLGGTLNSVKVTAKYGKANILADQFGKTVLDRRVNEVMISVTTALTEIKNKDLWKVVFPHATLVGSGPNKAVQFNTNVGDSDIDNALILTLHPLSRGPSDVNFDYTFYRAVSNAESEITYGPENQAILNIVWNILPDLSTSPARFMRYGDTTI